MRLTGELRKNALAGPPRRRRCWRIGIAGTISLLIHVVIGVMLLVTIQRQERSELLPPPSAVTMLFESGRRTGPTLPEPSPQATPSAPRAPPSPPPREAPLPAPPLPPPPQLPPAAPASPTPEAPALPPVEQPPAQRPQPELRPEPSPVPPPARQPPKPLPAKPPEFPAPMDFSFGKPLATAPVRPRSTPHIPGTIDMSLGPAAKGSANLTPFANRDSDADGADWRNALSRWVADHAYYPEQARVNGEEGDAKVHVVAAPDGRVTSVDLIAKSGSMWLDLALLSLFRDQHIPPLPFGDREPIEFNFTMHYVLIRPR
jgi:protein TonB